MKRISELQLWFADRLTSLQLPQEPRGLYEPMEYILGLGGKRLRPVLALVGSETVGGRAEDALGPALAVEIFHNFSLVHDDIMDDAPIRRGKPAVHTRWNLNTAILSGDALLVEAYRCLSRVPDPVLRDCLELFNRTATEVCEGQQWDMDFETRNGVSEEEYIRMIQYKTSVLLGAALKLGALAGGDSGSAGDRLYDFGLNIGTAFQIKDDWLDCFGNPEQVGKQPGGDILANKKTLLRIACERLGSAEINNELHSWDTRREEGKVEAVKELYHTSGAEAYTLQVMQHYHAEAMKSLEAVNGKTELLEELRGFADYLIDRHH